MNFNAVFNVNKNANKANCIICMIYAMLINHFSKMVYLTIFLCYFMLSYEILSLTNAHLAHVLPDRIKDKHFFYNFDRKSH